MKFILFLVFFLVDLLLPISGAANDLSSTTSLAARPSDMMAAPDGYTVSSSLDVSEGPYLYESLHWTTFVRAKRSSVHTSSDFHHLDNTEVMVADHSHLDPVSTTPSLVPKQRSAPEDLTVDHSHLESVSVGLSPGSKQHLTPEGLAQGLHAFRVHLQDMLAFSRSSHPSCAPSPTTQGFLLTNKATRGLLKNEIQRLAAIKSRTDLTRCNKTTNRI